MQIFKGTEGKIFQDDENAPTQEETKTQPLWTGSIPCIIFVVFWIAFPLLFYPYNFKHTSSSDYPPLHPGENFRLNVNPFWYKSIEVATDPPSENQQQLVFFDKCPEKNVTRFKSYNIDLQSSRRYNIDLKLSQWFRLNKGSNVTLTWETSKIVYFTIYNAWKEVVYQVKSDGQTDFSFQIKSSTYYNFHWSLDSKTQGVANFRFNLSSFDTSVAQKTCSLSKDQPCKFHFTHDSSCIVVDYDNLESNETIPFAYVKGEGDGKKYFLIVMLPIIVVLLSLWVGGLFYCINEDRRERRDDEEGQTEATIFLENLGVDQGSEKVVEMEEENLKKEEEEGGQQGSGGELNVAEDENVKVPE